MSRRILVSFAGGLLVLLVQGATIMAYAQERPEKLVVCQGCHGTDGLSKNPEAPNLAGQVQSYLVRALGAYRNGERQNEAMNIVAKELSDQEIEALATYYSGIQVDVIPP